MIRSAGSAVLALGTLLSGVPRPALSQSNRWERQVRDQLQRARAALGGRQATSPERIRIGPLNGEETERFAVTLEAGVAYTLIGVCDEDCASLQLVLSTSTSHEIAADRRSESFPVLRFTPPETASYRVKVTMAACRMNPCWYGVAVSRK
jgi:hypothetical protein